MLAAAQFLAEFLLLALYGFVPGAAFLVFVRFRSVSVLDALLACVGTSVAWTVFCVYGLLWVNAYTRATAALILLVPAGWLWYQVGRKGYRIRDMRIAGPGPPRTPALDRIVSAGVALFLLGCVIDASTSPITNWDGDITWDKWATDWGRRQHLYGYLLGGYPQLVPMYFSVLYKLTGAFGQALPLEQFVVHGVHGAFSFLLLAGIVRLAHVGSLPAWGAILLTFSNPAVRVAVMNPSADLVLISLTVTAVALYVSYIRGGWQSRFGIAGIAAPLLFGLGFTKATGVVWLLVPLSYLLRKDAWKDVLEVKSPGRGAVLASVGLPLLALLPFYAYQLAASPVATRLNPREVNFPASRMLTMLSNTTAAAYVDDGLGARIADASARLAGTVAPLPGWGAVIALLLLILVVLSSRNRLIRPLAFPCIVMSAVWFQLASYDLRNLLPVFPVAGILATAGALEIMRTTARKRSLMTVAVVCAGVIGGVWCLRVAHAGYRIYELFRKDAQTAQSAMDRRLEAMGSDLPARIKLYFPHEWPVYEFITSTRLSSEAANIMATSHLYRWFPRGAYPLAHWSSTWIRPGDWYVGMGPHKPPRYDAWTKLYENVLCRVWFAEVNPRSIPLSELLVTGATKIRTSTPALLEVDLNGGQGLIGYNVPDRDLDRDSVVVWRALVEADQVEAGVAAGVLASDPEIVDTARTAVAVDTELAAQHVVAYSGILALTGRALSQNPADRILVGIVSDSNNGRLRLKSFRVSIYR